VEVDVVRNLEETPIPSDQEIGKPRRGGWTVVTATVLDTLELRTWLNSLGKRAKRVRFE
jgi:hypothetical protein